MIPSDCNRRFPAPPLEAYFDLQRFLEGEEIRHSSLSPCERVSKEVEKLDKLVKAFRATKSPLGYFAVVYRQMTESVEDCMTRNDWRVVQHQEMMADFIEMFAARYYDALSDPSHATQSWRWAFHSQSAPAVTQILVSMNAHIRLDLGLALAVAALAAARKESAPNAAGCDRAMAWLERFRDDFDTINKLVSGYDPAAIVSSKHGVPPVAGMVTEVTQTIRRIDPIAALIDTLSWGTAGKALSSGIVLSRIHSVDIAREAILRFGKEGSAGWYAVENAWDSEVARLGATLAKTNSAHRVALRLLRPLGQSPEAVIDRLEKPSAKPSPATTVLSDLLNNDANRVPVPTTTLAPVTHASGIAMENTVARVTCWHEVAAPPETVWEWLSTPRLINRWSQANVSAQDKNRAPHIGEKRTVTIKLGPLAIQKLEETIVAAQKGFRLTYEGLNVAEHKGEFLLYPTRTGTGVVVTARFTLGAAWHTQIAAKLIRRQLKTSLISLAQQLAESTPHPNNDAYNATEPPARSEQAA